MIKLSGPIVQNSTNVRIIVFVIIIERIEEHPQSVPAVRRTKHITIVFTFLWCVPQCQTISSNSSATGNTKNNFDFPIIEIGLRFRPNGSLLTPKRWSYSNTFGTSDGICLIEWKGKKYHQNQWLVKNRPTCHKKIIQILT